MSEVVPPDDGNPTVSRGRWRSRSWPVAALMLAGAVVLWVGLTVDGPRGDDARPGEFRGSVLPEPMPKPTFTLTDSDGKAYDFGHETDGRLTLLFFGFTHCPDVCPVHLANIAAVLEDVPPHVRQQIRVVFVTADPERDTPARLRTWLDAFDPGFIGLRGSVDEINGILSDLRLPPVVHAAADASGNYSVGHPAQILVFTPDNYLRLMYPFGTRQADWARDLPKLASFEPVEGRPAPRGPDHGATTAYVPVPAADGPAALYVTVRNRAMTADTLVGASTRVAASVRLHRHVSRDGVMIMEAAAGAPVEARDSLSLVPGGYHLMLHDLTTPLAVGDTFTVQLQFRRSAALSVRAVVVPYTALEHMLPAPTHAAH